MKMHGEGPHVGFKESSIDSSADDNMYIASAACVQLEGCRVSNTLLA